MYNNVCMYNMHCAYSHLHHYHTLITKLQILRNHCISIMVASTKGNNKSYEDGDQMAPTRPYLVGGA